MCPRRNRPHPASRRPWQAISRHARQIGKRSAEECEGLTSLYSLTFRPGDRTDTFAGKPLQPIGTSVAIVLQYEPRAIPVSGYRLQLGTDGHISAGDDGWLFLHDAGAKPRFDSGSRAINIRLNPSLVETAMRMDAACLRHWRNQRHPTLVPQLPGVQLGFALSQPPVFEITEALKRRAARRAGISLDRLTANPEVIVDRLLRDTWESCLVAPGTPENPTDLLLVDAEFCTQAHHALRVFEDYRALVGVPTWNPARLLEPLRVGNPAVAILSCNGIDPSSDFAETISSEMLEKLEQGVRSSLGELSPRFSDEDVLDCLANPGQPLAAYDQLLPTMRSKLQPYWSECSTDSDLRSATKNPDGALFASGACRVQVLGRLSEQSLCFAPSELGRRAHVDWNVPQFTAFEPELTVSQ